MNSRLSYPVFAKLKKASEILGISVYALRQGCKDGTVPHIMAGRDYLVNIEATIEKLTSASK